MDKYAELGMEVAVSQIDGELKKLWEQDDASTNASLMNLVVFTEKEGGLLENSRIINDLTRENACRAILVEINSEADPSIRAWITAHCHLSGGKKSVCCEQISFYLTGRVTGRFRNTVFSHLNSDLPLVFWWQGELSDVFTERLVSVIDRLIVDSSAWQNPKASFSRILESVDDNTKLTVQDLAWTRCWQFRASIAGLFDDSVAQTIIGNIEKVKITHHASDRNTALQILAWLAVQAGWKSTGKLLFETRNGTKIIAEIEASEDSAPISLVEISAGETVVRVSREKDSAHLLREIQSGDYHVSSLSPADPEASADLVAEQLARGGKNSLFLKILPQFLELI
ncbi:MAG: glucose-6-phosphate dehydrogenase assembly protein OpcA [Akkermansiaceae bacterium]|jgi:glucose-6-phosphate dehydrogenase assembly protein OpcA|nr:glucose-6-phosphate dehydrogenase assembly protein OpcA [Akkermansiaceae bacterium]MDP4780481.1 glucose-6-phosphate dehydrogenase assembly protein OpcA [Akkermansiaceae bacterium]MDP4847278.1 glucose-6-phosphate dehydrogenase assembly protein OpcA [Akkermansiaceae bacterium]MDP4995970.1 glucose-6-phosphate dehydrogenase assembly protein OpcA [Akkermansiaceae bacterium]